MWSFNKAAFGESSFDDSLHTGPENGVFTYTSVFKCVLQRAHSVGERRCVRGATGVSATPCVSETPCVEATLCVSGVVASVPECVLPSMPCVKGAPQVEGAACAP